MDYKEIAIWCAAEDTEIIQAILVDEGYESFLEEETQQDSFRFQAFIPAPQFDETVLRQLTRIERYTVKHIEHQNWNALWESNYDPIILRDQILVKAAFHEVAGTFRYQLEINPKMSFGTGHHATTKGMMELLLRQDLVGKSVLDCGCGTGILALLAKQMGASYVEGFDIEDWTTENAQENASVNALEATFWHGTISDRPEPKRTFDVLLANINLNVLLTEIPIYLTYMEAGGTLCLSGFYQEDRSQIRALVESVGGVYVHEEVIDQWVAMQFRKR